MQMMSSLGYLIMSEFTLVDKAAKLFELSSGCALHRDRDPVSGKCKVLPLGRWRGTLQQEDILYPYMKLCDTLEMVGVDLTANWQASRRINNDDLQSRVQRCIGAWKSGKFMPLVSRPFSINTYCLSKVWFRAGSVDMRVGDITAITSRVKSYCYQDLYQKPSEVLLYRREGEGGLGLYHLQSKALAHLISKFIQTAANPKYIKSLFHTWLFRYHVLGELDLPNPGYTPYDNQSFVEVIKYGKEKTPLNPVSMSIKQWYRLLLEKNVIMRVVDQEDRMELIPCKVEDRQPEVVWPEVYRASRLTGLSPECKSFLFQLVHPLLPSKERIHHLNPNTSPLCWCNSGAMETYQHLFFQCEINQESGQALLRCVRTYDRTLSDIKLLRLELSTDEPFLLASVSLVSCGLKLIWESRKIKKRTSLFDMRAELESAITIKRKSRLRKVREAGSIMKNMIENFLQ